MDNAIVERIIASAQILIVPGLNGSGPGHWQTIWEEKYGWERVNQRDWGNPDLTLWVDTLNAVITTRSDRTAIVAHSLGCLTVAQWAKAFPENAGRIQCALLVAPPDVESSPDIPEALRQFASHEVLPFPSILVGSESDHYMTLKDAQKLAAGWESRFINVGASGHINVDSGHGSWPQGEKLLTDLVKISTK